MAEDSGGKAVAAEVDAAASAAAAATGTARDALRAARIAHLPARRVNGTATWGTTTATNDQAAAANPLPMTGVDDAMAPTMEKTTGTHAEPVATTAKAASSTKNAINHSSLDISSRMIITAASSAAATWPRTARYRRVL